jgi:fructosamine-3-kinase
VESLLLDRVRAAGVRTPQVFGSDVTRAHVPFAWQVLERIPAPDLNHWHKLGALDSHRIAFELGAAVGQWQDIALERFGALDLSLAGYRASYADYFHLRLGAHLDFLIRHGFLTAEECAGIEAEIACHEELLALASGCLVHKDLALWNVLGTAHAIAAFIDFDDAISGDPMDDLSLLGCFHDAAFLRRAFEGYESKRTLPKDHRRRFWLHLLRNMIVKAVIRVGAGYLARDNDFFLIQPGGSGASLKEFTQKRLSTALQGLRDDRDLSIL